ncbi:MAG TPA: DmsC/YnfH family molybdoenzyme membrane anchor subunit [Bacteroidales bacterium]|nr:DmsC/YnfH family molybdoenzyme membrane anchor subunit [Bacteroidales bacterium]
MRKGFIFNPDFCTGCKACRAGCMLTNGWTTDARKVYTGDEGTGSVVNISISCNHCQDPVCLKGCPSGVYIRDEISGAVLINDKFCLGCRYCLWNCPYGAPDFNYVSGIVEKCHLCHNLLKHGEIPACASACPTGALSFGGIPFETDEYSNELAGGKYLNPSLIVQRSCDIKGPEMIPSPGNENSEDDGKRAFSPADIDYSLVGFSYLSTISVSVAASGIFSGTKAGRPVALVLLVASALFSLFHLGKPARAWRSLANIRYSPLSREIAGLILFGALLTISLFADALALRISVVASGLVFLLLIDTVYSWAEGSLARFHSGQTFLTGLLITSFFSYQAVPFLFVATIKLLILIRSGNLRWRIDNDFVLRYTRLAFLLISVFIMITGSTLKEPSAIIILLSGELADRIIFYLDFSPPDIKKSIKSYN